MRSARDTVERTKDIRGALSMSRLPSIEVSPGSVLVDGEVHISVFGLAPSQLVRLRLTMPVWGALWSSEAVFVADEAGRLDLATAAPVEGDYAGVDAMGLIWSARRRGKAAGRAAKSWSGAQQGVSIVAEVQGLEVARHSFPRMHRREGVCSTPVGDCGLVGSLYEPPGPGPHPCLLVVGGSRGGLRLAAHRACLYASHGYAALALAYFGMEGLPRTLTRIPLEYFQTALEWLRAHPSVDPLRVGISGTSRGGELALLLASRVPEIRAVVAYVPSHVVWPSSYVASQAAWSSNGQPLLSVRFTRDWRAVYRRARRSGPNASHWYLASLEDEGAIGPAVIPVEDINGPVLLVSGQDDWVWPSAYMAVKVMERLERHSHPYRRTHLTYADAGHMIGVPYWPTVNLPLGNGGTPPGYARAMADSWPKVLGFLAGSLGGAPPGPMRTHP